MIKKIIGDIFGFNKTIELLNNKLSVTEIEISALNKVIKILNADIEDLKNENNSLLELYADEIEEEKIENYWNNKYKKAIIEYNGRTLPNSTTKCKIPVNLLITPNDNYIIEDLKKWGLYRTDEDPETLIPKIYKKIKKEYYNYEFDKNVWGTSEIWEFPFEMREKAKLNNSKWEYDCDSWSSLMVSYYIAAGVPRWRVRVVVGNCYLGGHSTVYCYSKADDNWHHLNSTYGTYSYYSKLHKFPTHKDARDKENKAKDRLGIYKVWLSYNDLYCWYDFKGDIPKELQLR